MSIYIFSRLNPLFVSVSLHSYSVLGMLLKPIFAMLFGSVRYR